jgi:hypothetical protein
VKQKESLNLTEREAGVEARGNVPEVGRVLSVALLSDLSEVGRLNRGEIAALAGVAPFNCDSPTLHGQSRIAVSMGTRFRGSDEAAAKPAHKKRITLSCAEASPL